MQREPSLKVMAPSVAGWSDDPEMAPPSVRLGELGAELGGFRIGAEAQYVPSMAGLQGCEFAAVPPATSRSGMSIERNLVMMTGTRGLTWRRSRRVLLRGRAD